MGVLTRRRRSLGAGVSVVAALALTAAPAAAAHDVRLDHRTRTKLDRALRSTMRRTHSPGAIAGVWVGNRGWTARRGTTRRGARRTNSEIPNPGGGSPAPELFSALAKVVARHQFPTGTG